MLHTIFQPPIHNGIAWQPPPWCDAWPCVGEALCQMILRRLNSFVCLFVCLFVGIKPEKLYAVSFVGKEVNPLGVITHGQRRKSPKYQRQRYRPRTCQTMINTLHVDGLWTYASPMQGAFSATERRPPMPCLTYWFWTVGGVKS